MFKKVKIIRTSIMNKPEKSPILKFRLLYKCQNGHLAYEYKSVSPEGDALMDLWCTSDNPDCKCSKALIGEGWEPTGVIERFSEFVDSEKKDIYEGDKLTDGKGEIIIQWYEHGLGFNHCGDICYLTGNKYMQNVLSQFKIIGNSKGVI
jgi:hypothetical protein